MKGDHVSSCNLLGRIFLVEIGIYLLEYLDLVSMPRFTLGLGNFGIRVAMLRFDGIDEERLSNFRSPSSKSFCSPTALFWTA